MQQVYSNLYFAMNMLRAQLLGSGQVVQTEKWQGIEKPPAMLEVLHTGFTAVMPTQMDALIYQVKPDLPWADDHFRERVCGEPLNPGVQYKKWPYYKDVSFNDKSFRKDNLFSHTYMERYWPKHAGEYFATSNSKTEVIPATQLLHTTRMGIRYELGDLNDVICLLRNEPHTRQAYMPVWFPEDTGVLHGGRVPCSIGYHFIMRDQQLHIHYTLRSCDAVRHFKNDVYLTIKLVYHVLDKLRRMDMIYGDWHKITPGLLTMQIMSFHCFEKEKNLV